MDVKKFGGTSLGTLDRIEAVAERLSEAYNQGERFAVVVSAMSGETNRLVSMAQSIDPSYRGPAYDVLLASGEQVAIALLTIALEKHGVQAKALLAFQLGIKTDSLHTKARILEIETFYLRELLDSGVVPVIAGFQGIDKKRNVTTLGRGGSDTTAVALAAAMKFDSCEIYTDVESVFTADPRLVSKAREIPVISFEEMMEMASLGSKVLHIRSVEIAAKFGVKIHVRSTFSSREGTWIVGEQQRLEYIQKRSVNLSTECSIKFSMAPNLGNNSSNNSTSKNTTSEKHASENKMLASDSSKENSLKIRSESTKDHLMIETIESLNSAESSEMAIENAMVTAVTHDSQTAVVELFPVPAGSHFLADLFGELSTKGISVDIINQSLMGEGQRLSFSVTHEDLTLAKEVLIHLQTRYPFKITVRDQKAKISVVGVGMRNHPGVAALFFKTLAELDVAVELVTTSEIKISAVIEPNSLKRAAEGLHHAFNLDC